MNEISRDDWITAEMHLLDVERAYRSLGFVGSIALRCVIQPLLNRYNDGERTERLYEEIMNLK